MLHKDSREVPASGCSSRLKTCVCVGILFLTPAFFAYVKAQINPPVGDDEVLRVNTDLILFPARIRKSRGQGSVEQSEFEFQPIRDPDHVTSGLYLKKGVDRVAMVFVLDQSGSVRELIAKQREAAVGLFEHFGGKSSIAVLHFAETSTIAAPFLRDPAAARSAFEISANRNQHTAIFDAAAKAVEMFDTLPRVRSERRIIILISDGLDTASRTKPNTVIEAAREKRVSFYVIHLPLFEPRDERLIMRRPSKGFADLAVKTGGVYLYPGDSAFDMQKNINLSLMFQAIEDDLKSQILIGFYLNAKAHDGKQHKFSLSLPAGLEYQIGDRNYAATHKFVVH